MQRRALCVAQATAGAARSGPRIRAGGRTSDGAAVPRNGPCRVASSLVRATALLALVPCHADSAARDPDDVHSVGHSARWADAGVPRPADSRLPAPRSAVPARVGVLDRRHGPGSAGPCCPGRPGPSCPPGARRRSAKPRRRQHCGSWRPSSGAGWRVVDLVADGLAAESAPPIARPELLVCRFSKGLFASFIKQFMTCNLEEAKKNHSKDV